MKTELPFVSVIVPVLNNNSGLQNLLENLDLQTYPKNKFEVLVIDNGSKELLQKKYSNMSVQYFAYSENKNSFACRNIGIKNSKGTICAFIDSDCTPHKDWLTNGITHVVQTDSDLVGGNIHQVISDATSASQWADAMNNLNNKHNIEHRHTAFTANLFVRKKVFETIGYFDEVMSGADSLFTNKSWRSDFVLTYCDNAIVDHETRNFLALMQKAKRIGIGKKIARKQKLKRNVAPKTSLHLQNLYPKTFKENLKNYDVPTKKLLTIKIYIIQFLYMTVFKLYSL